MKKSFNVLYLIIGIILILFSLSITLLIGWGIINSFKDYMTDFRKNTLGFPLAWTFDNYLTVFNKFYVRIPTAGFPITVGLGEQLLNTLIYCVLASTLASFVPCFTGYLVAKYNYLFSKILFNVAIVAMALPIIGAYPSELKLLTSLGVRDTFFSVIFQRSGYLGLYFFVFVAAFKSIPNDFYEAATIDGAGEFQVFVRIMFPMVLKTYLTIVLLLFVANWNDYQYPIMYLKKRPTVSYGLYYMLNWNPDNSLAYTPILLAGCCVLMIPILILFILFKEKLMGNLSMGGLKE